MTRIKTTPELLAEARAHPQEKEKRAWRKQNGIVLSLEGKTNEKK